MKHGAQTLLPAAATARGLETIQAATQRIPGYPGERSERDDALSPTQTLAAPTTPAEHTQGLGRKAAHGMELPPRARHEHAHEHARDEHENRDEHQGRDEHDGAQSTDPGPRDGQEHAESPLLSMRPRIELEPGWIAANGLERNNSDELLALMLRPSFRPARELDLVPVAPCGLCQDGGLRTAGTVRTRHGRQLVRACDTCGAVVLSEWQPWQNDRYARDA